MRLFKAAFLAAAMTLTLPSAASLAATPADVLVVAQNIDDIVSIDPAEAYEFSSGEYVTQTYDRLVQYDADDVNDARGRPRHRVDGRRRRQDHHLHHARRRQVPRPAIRCAPRTSSIPSTRVVMLNLSPAFILTQLGWTPENIADDGHRRRQQGRR